MFAVSPRQGGAAMTKRHNKGYDARPRLLAGISAVGLLVALLAGCSSVRTTNPPRTATEQFLLSGAAATAVRQLTTEALRDRKVFVDDAYYAAESEGFVIAELRAHLLINGVRLVPVRDNAELVLEVRSGGVGIDRYDFLLGLVSIPITTGEADGAGGPFGGSFVLPELPIYKTIRQRGFASIAYVAYWEDTGEVFAASGPYVGQTFRNDLWILGFGPQTAGDIPPAEIEMGGTAAQ